MFTFLFLFLSHCGTKDWLVMMSPGLHEWMSEFWMSFANVVILGSYLVPFGIPIVNINMSDKQNNCLRSAKTFVLKICGNLGSLVARSKQSQTFKTFRQRRKCYVCMTSHHYRSEGRNPTGQNLKKQKKQNSFWEALVNPQTHLAMSGHSQAKCIKGHFTRRLNALPF